MKGWLIHLRFVSRVILFATMLSAFVVKADWTLNFDTYYGASSVNPGTPTPWVSVTFMDVAPGTVLMAISNSPSLTPTMKMDAIYFNFNPNLDLSSLIFSTYDSDGSFSLPTISMGTNAFMASEDGRFDLRFQFSTGGGFNSTFNGGEFAIYEFTGIDNLSSADFAFLSAANSGGNSAFAVGHLLGVNNGLNSAWIAPSGIALVPEPSSISLWGSGLAVFLLKRRPAAK